MKWFKRKSKAKKDSPEPSASYTSNNGYDPAPRGPSYIANVPPPILERVFAFVCPHARDETYESCEQSALEDTCMLCDLRDLSHCAQVSRRWRILASNVLYHSIRIDQVHYCEREDILAEKRKRRSFLRSNAEPEDTAQARLRFLTRTLREDNTGVALKVHFLKLPYMTRETCKPDLARAVQVLPNLRYVDLPEGFFSDDPSCNTLKQEVQANCRDIRKMSYVGGAERSLELLAGGALWRNLEVLELSKLNMDPTILRSVLGFLPQLRALKVQDMKTFRDELFQHSDYLPPFPALDELVFENTPMITVEGLATYLFRSDTQDTLKTLSLSNTGVSPADLYRLLASAPRLQHLSIIESVTTSFPAANVPRLQSNSLVTFHYEISSVTSANSYASTIASYYAYLTSSLMSGGLPNLEELYVRDPDFPETLLDLAPPKPFFASDPDNFSPQSPNQGGGHQRSSSNPFLSAPHSQSGNTNRFSSNNPFASPQPQGLSPSLSSPSFTSNSISPQSTGGGGLPRTLQVYSKGLDEMEWNFSSVAPAMKGQRRGSATAMRPVSSYGLTESVGKSWAGRGSRMSVVVGNGFGGFLAVPADDEGPVGGRPSTSDGSGAGGGRGVRRGSKGDLWR